MKKFPARSSPGYGASRFLSLESVLRGVLRSTLCRLSQARIRSPCGVRSALHQPRSHPLACGAHFVLHQVRSRPLATLCVCFALTRTDPGRLPYCPCGQLRLASRAKHTLRVWCALRAAPTCSLRSPFVCVCSCVLRLSRPLVCPALLPPFTLSCVYGRGVWQAPPPPIISLCTPRLQKIFPPPYFSPRRTRKYSAPFSEALLPTSKIYVCNVVYLPRR